MRRMWDETGRFRKSEVRRWSGMGEDRSRRDARVAIKGKRPCGTGCRACPSMGPVPAPLVRWMRQTPRSAGWVELFSIMLRCRGRIQYALSSILAPSFAVWGTEGYRLPVPTDCSVVWLERAHRDDGSEACLRCGASRRRCRGNEVRHVLTFCTNRAGARWNGPSRHRLGEGNQSCARPAPP